RLVEWLTIAAGAGTLLLVLFHALYLEPAGSAAGAALVHALLWLPAVYLFAFLVLEARRALLVALFTLALFVAISLPNAIETMGGPRLGDGFGILGVAYLANALFVTALYFFARIKRGMQRAQLEASMMWQLAHTDALTGLPNRRQMEVLIESEIRRAERYSRPFCVVLIDIDNFKHFNDTFGHEVGDKVLAQMAHTVRHALRQSDTFGRWGGEEFILLVPETDVQGSLQLAEQIRLRVLAQQFPRNQTVTISCGIAAFRPGDGVQRLVNRADSALYRAKGQGKNRVVETKTTLF
ncbi:MAG TPA: GGDEF domain-containing protein, partial [Trueperaceae bacterium]